MDIAIIGAGFSGLAIAWHLLAHRPSCQKLNIHIFDSKPIGQGTSGIAAGLLHPFVGAHAKLNKMGLEGFHATQKLLDVASRALGRSVTAEDKGILRPALNAEQYADYQRCAALHPHQVQWIDAAACQQLAPGCAYSPGLWIKGGLTVYAALYLEGLWQACAQQGIKFEQRTIRALDELDDFDLTIGATGADYLQLPELADLPLSRVKGQVLELAWPEGHPPLNCALNSHIYLLMSENKKTCLIGSTYERGFQEMHPDQTIAEKEILPKAIELYPPLIQSEVMNCYAGVRAVTPQRLPWIKRLSASRWILIGMGSRGLLYHALYAKNLVQQIWQEGVVR